MAQIWLRFDLRSPRFGIGTERLCAAALEQVEWADKQGFDAVQLPEHHGSDDGYNPSAFVFGAAIAARSSRLRINPSAVLLPLHDPIRIAEDAAVLDNISGGRLDLTIGLGYLPSEFDMFGVSLKQRGKLVESKFKALRRALAGETFTYEGRTIRVTPRPVQQPTPPLYIGGGVTASAVRAATIGDGFSPSKPGYDIIQCYLDACATLGKTPGPVINTASGPQFIFVAEDPDKAWQKIAPYALYETNSYAKWASEASPTNMPFKPITGIEELKKSGIYQVVTPDDCIALGTELHRKNIVMMFNSLLAGLPEDLSWSSLELFAKKVLPTLKNLA